MQLKYSEKQRLSVLKALKRTVFIQLNIFVVLKSNLLHCSGGDQHVHDIKKCESADHHHDIEKCEIANAIDVRDNECDPSARHTVNAINVRNIHNSQDSYVFKNKSIF